MKTGPNTRTLWHLWKALVIGFILLIIATFLHVSFGNYLGTLLDKDRLTAEDIKAIHLAIEHKKKRERSENFDLVENGIHVKTGLANDEHLPLIIGACTSCHSAKLITQNRATRDGWKAMIRWMQETQGLVDLGIQEPKILDYLAEHYAPKEVGRRQSLDVDEIEWYILELE